MLYLGVPPLCTNNVAHEIWGAKQCCVCRGEEYSRRQSSHRQ